jgi:hypothetical protein
MRSSPDIGRSEQWVTRGEKLDALKKMDKKTGLLQKTLFSRGLKKPPTSGGRSVGIVRSRTQATEDFFLFDFTQVTLNFYLLCSMED